MADEETKPGENAHEVKMRRFFNGLSGKERRRMRLAYRKITGHKETLAQMLDRVHQQKVAREKK